MDANTKKRISEALRSLDEADADLKKLGEIRERQIATVAQIGTLSTELAAGIADCQAALMQATRSMQETQMSFNLQYLQLQSQMQNESRQYTAVSNIMKTKHDTVKNSISNIR